MTGINGVDTRVDVTLSTGEIAPVTRVVAAELAKLKAQAARAESKAAKAKTDAYEREKSVRDARRRLDAEEAAERSAGLGSVRDRLLGVDEFIDAEPPPALVRDVLDGGGLSMLVGHRGSYKTAVALDVALCIACGGWWGRHQTTRGRVLYLVGEGGGRAFGIRLEAWLAHHRITRDAIRPWFKGLNGAAPFLSPAWEELVDVAVEFAPALVVVDTLARHQVGLEENSNTDASEAVAKANHLQQRTNAAVMVLHHPPASGGRARGATAWEGAADSVFYLEKDEPVPGQVQMTTTKQKHRPETGTWAFRIEQVPVRENGIWPTSMVPVHADPFTVTARELEAKATAEATLDAEVLAFIREREAADLPPNMTDLDLHFPGRREQARDAVTRLSHGGHVVVRKAGNSKRLHTLTDAAGGPDEE